MVYKPNPEQEWRFLKRYLLEKKSDVVGQSKTSYIHQIYHNKKLFDMSRGDLSLTMIAMIIREGSKNCQKIISFVYIQGY